MFIYSTLQRYERVFSMRFYCQFVNMPAVGRGHEKDFPPSIVDTRDAEPIASIIARMVQGDRSSLREGVYDGEDPDKIDICEDVDFDPADASFDVPADTKPADTKSANPPADSFTDPPEPSESK